MVHLESNDQKDGGFGKDLSTAPQQCAQTDLKQHDRCWFDKGGSDRQIIQRSSTESWRVICASCLWQLLADR